MAGPDEIDGGAWKLDLPACAAKSLRDLRVAVKLIDPNSIVETEYVDKLQALVDALAKRGAKVKEIEPNPRYQAAGYSSLVYLPSTVGPAGLTKSALPVGYQAIAASGRDKTAIAFSRFVEKELLGFVPPMGFD
jgi:Asp-tRNA(Asn)/Glu-tRNA(Gln) amidotransferase A subunit family amidase